MAAYRVRFRCLRHMSTLCTHAQSQESLRFLPFSYCSYAAPVLAFQLRYLAVGSCSYTPTKPHSPRADLFRMNVCFIPCEIPWTRTEGLC
jgi:hypothetical protein